MKIIAWMQYVNIHYTNYTIMAEVNKMYMHLSPLELCNNLQINHPAKNIEFNAFFASHFLLLMLLIIVTEPLIFIILLLHNSCYNDKVVTKQL